MGPRRLVHSWISYWRTQVFITAAQRVINLLVTTAENSSTVLNSNHVMLQFLLNWNVIHVLARAQYGSARHSRVVFRSVQNLATNLVLLSQLFGQLSQ